MSARRSPKGEGWADQVRKASARTRHKFKPTVMVGFIISYTFC